MGKLKLGDCIRRTDYLNARKEYKSVQDDPSQQLKDVHSQCKNISFEELKDAFVAVGEKVGVKDFPPKDSPAYKVAYTTVKILKEEVSQLKKTHEDLTLSLTEVVFHTVVAMLRAGAGTTHCAIIMELYSFQNFGIHLETYAQALKQKELGSVVAATMVAFTYNPSDYISERNHAALQNDALKRFFVLFSSEQLQSIQREFLEVYIHYHMQLPGLSEVHVREMQYVIKEMTDKFEQKNPYLHMNDPQILASHLDVITRAVRVDGYRYRSNLDDSMSGLLEKILQATIADGLIAHVLDRLMQVLLDVISYENARQQSERILEKYRIYFFREIPANTPSEVIYKPCIYTMHKILLKDEIKTQHEIGLVEEAADKLIVKATKLTPDDVKVALMLIRDMLYSGRKILIEKSVKTLEAMIKSKAVDWKLYVKEAGEILMTVAEIPDDRIQDDDNSWRHSTESEYQSFYEKFLKMMKKGKILQQLQSHLVNVFFIGLGAGSKMKIEIAYKCSDDENIDISDDPALRIDVLQKVSDLLRKENLPWEDWRACRALEHLMESVVKSFDTGSQVTDMENDLLMEIFKQCSVGEESIEEHWFQEENEETPNVKFSIWWALVTYAGLHNDSKTCLRLAPIMSEVLRWAKIATDENHKDLLRITFDILQYVSSDPPAEFKEYLPDVIDLMLQSQRCRILDTFITKLYPHNPKAVHDKLQDIFESLEDMKYDEVSYLLCIINEIAQVHAEEFSRDQIQILLDMYQKVQSQHERNIIIIIFKHISETHPQGLVNIFPQLCDDTIFSPETLNFRANTIACVGAVSQQLGQKAVDYLMKYIDYADGSIALYVVGTLNSIVRKYGDYMQKYKAKLQKVETNGKVPQTKDLAHSIVLVLEGKSVEKIAEDVQQQQDDMDELDEKVDTTMNTVVTIGEKVIEHDKEIDELGEGLERVEERVDNVEEDLGDTKIQVEAIDSKTMTNAPKWSRDLTKLMNPEAEGDWRLLASRLGYNNDDVRAWATQHDPCMALLSEWYATHKTSEASVGVLTALIEMNRMDGAAIVENAMKQAEGVVEDEEFEYPSPPPVFISYQWGFQEEVKLLKKHLNMAGYECWMDVGQMGGGDKLFAKIDNGIRGAKSVICCVTEKYAQSPNCNRELERQSPLISAFHADRIIRSNLEFNLDRFFQSIIATAPNSISHKKVNLSVSLNKPIIPLLMEKMDWPPKGSMGPIFSEYLFIRFFQRPGEVTPEKDQRYWPIPKFQELLMQLNFFAVPDQNMVQNEYAHWWAPLTEDIVIDKHRNKKQAAPQKSVQKDSQAENTQESPLVFLSYQWGKQPQVKALYRRLTSLGYTVWMDIYQMGGGDSLYDKIDKGMRGCKAVVSCVTQKYSLSANCRREVSLADALKKPIIPLLMEQIKWPPDGPMSMLFTELLFINFYRDEAIQMTWTGEKFDEFVNKLNQFVPSVEPDSGNGSMDNKSHHKKKQIKKQESPSNKKNSSYKESVPNIHKTEITKTEVDASYNNNVKKSVTGKIVTPKPKSLETSAYPDINSEVAVDETENANKDPSEIGTKMTRSANNGQEQGQNKEISQSDNNKTKSKACNIL